ncbi:MAG: BON domain-containing protein [Planctomycetales bacterium]|nr:BON domain-containing protein [Planctomycetales bacterium]
MKTDVHLQRDVLDELDWEPSIDAAQIGVTAHEGVVTLFGHVPTYADKHLAEEAAKRIHGVLGVANEIEVRPEGIDAHDDEELAAAAVHALQWDASVPEGGIQVTVEDAWVRLEGNVAEHYQREASEEAIRRLVGVRGVKNDILVLPVEMQTEIMTHIDAAMQRSALLNLRQIQVEIHDRSVTLTGDVHTQAEFAEAERIALANRGVQRVINCLTITPWGTGVAEEWGY